MVDQQKQILMKLDEIKSELDFIKQNMVNPDSILDEDDRSAILRARQEFKEGKTVSMDKLKKEIGL